MTSEELYEVLGDINEKYVKDVKEYHKVKKSVWLKWSVMAACLCLIVIITTPFLYKDKSAIDSPGESKIHIFSSYDEFANVVPNMRIIEQLVNIDGVDVAICGTFVDLSIEDSTKVENYAWFDIEAKHEDNYIATIQLKLNDADSADSYVRNHALANETEINGEHIFYTYNADMGYWDSIIEMDGHFYNVHYYGSEETEFHAFINVLLAN